MKLFLVCLAGILSYCEAYKVLVVFSLAGKGQSILGDGIVRHLVNDGHEVTYITPFPYEPASPNVRTIDVSENTKFMSENMISIESIMKKETDMSDHVLLFFLFTDLPRRTLENENVQRLINDPKEEFDVIIAEWMFSELMSGLAQIFDCPLIWFSSIAIQSTSLRLIDGLPNPAYSGDITTTTLPPFTFWQRVNELFILLKVSFLKTALFDVMEGWAYDNLVTPVVINRGRQPPSYYDVIYNSSLFLVNTHPSLSIAQPMPQNSILIGGYHIDTNVQQLPEDLKKVMDSAKNGVIYFSLGSNLQSKSLPKELKDSILRMFGELKQTVLWKFEGDLPNRPKNVHILKWAPQQSILSHPNTVLFITQGGLQSITETVHFGKPIIGIPVLPDQFLHVEMAVQRGIAKKVDLSYTMVGDMKSAIEEVLSNPRYAEKAKELSFIYHDRPVHPGKKLVHWVKHVIKTRGALHLRSPALNVPLYQKLYLDLLVVVLVVLFVFVKVLKLVYRMFCKKNNTNTIKKNN